MEILQWCKVQIICLLILAVIGAIYIREGNAVMKLCSNIKCKKSFDAMLVVSEIAVLFDGITAVAVNYTDIIQDTVNMLLHLMMFLSYELFVVLLLWYWVKYTTGLPKNKTLAAMFVIPGVLSMIATIFTIHSLNFIEGKYTWYSMGIPVYICFGTIFVYAIMTTIFLFTRYRYIPKKRRQLLFLTLIVVIVVLSLQVIFPECLISCFAIVLIIVSIYINMENPAITEVKHYHHEMVTGFATLVENKDDSTGGHIRRSSAYAVLIAENLRKTKKYKNIITKDYINTLELSAPMHDIGKIGIPDEILQKPGKLTDEEFTKMKEHPVIGGKIIHDTFGHLSNTEYETMAHDIALYHHEKWSGRGYPEGLDGEDIPLCARIMAVADVFDAVSAKRCYRDAMPLPKCYEIITSGRGTDFDPDIVDAFMLDIEQVENIYNSSF